MIHFVRTLAIGMATLAVPSMLAVLLIADMPANWLRKAQEVWRAVIVIGALLGVCWLAGSAWR